MLWQPYGKTSGNGEHRDGHYVMAHKTSNFGIQMTSSTNDHHCLYQTPKCLINTPNSVLIA